MNKKSKYKLYIWLMILSGIILAITLTMTSLKIIRGGKNFTQAILEENRIFVINTIRFGHGMMGHSVTGGYDSLIDLALKSKFICYLAILDKGGKIVAQSDPPHGLISLKNEKFSDLKDGEILEESKDILLVTYRAKKQTVRNGKHMRRHTAFRGQMGADAQPGWFLVGLDTTIFKRHYRDMLLQTVGTGAVFLLLGILIIIFLGIIQRYELAHSSIERLRRIRRLLEHFVPKTAKDIIEKSPEGEGLLDKYIQDATVLFLDIEGFSLLLHKYSQDRINHTIESYFSYFLELIQKNEGDINETAGDGMMVIFLHSDPTQHARNAVWTALDIQKQCLKISQDEDPELFPIRVNIGICSGEVYLGSTKMRGTEWERWTFTASGSVTIMASRLAQHAREGQILIGEETAHRVDKLFSLNPIGSVPLKNIKDSGKVYEIDLPLGRP